MQPDIESLLLTYDEVAGHLRVSRRYVEQMVTRHELPALRVGDNAGSVAPTFVRRATASKLKRPHSCSA